jgi:subtilisin family serine protease
MFNRGKLMHYALRALLVLVFATSAMAADFRAGEVIVKFKDGAAQSRKAMEALYDAAGVKSVKRFAKAAPGLEHLTLLETVKVQDAIAALEKSDAVEYAQPNYLLHAFPIQEAAETESVPCRIPGVNWPPGCESSGTGPIQPGPRPELKPAPAEVTPPQADPSISLAYGLQKIGAVQAWKEWAGSKQLIVADIDTGIDYNHEDLSFNLWRNPNPGPKNDVVGYNFIHNDGLPYDDNQHGTHTAGTIGAVGGNGKGVAGVAQRVSLMTLKFLSAKGEGDTMGAIKSIDYAVAHGAKILNNSWGGPADGDNRALSDAIERANQKGVLFVAAAGNGDQFGRPQNNDVKPTYPAAFRHANMLTVAATDSADKMASFSNYGKTSVHLAAPGVKVHSTTPGNKYQAFSGTSMACPHVVGAAALVWSKNPTWSMAQVKDALLKSVDPIPALKGKTVTGGRLNVLKALRSTE